MSSAIPPGHPAERFIGALRALEDDRDVRPLVEVFADDAEISNVVSPQLYRGTDGAREFWESYRRNFGAMRSTFRRVVIDGDDVALEWQTTGDDGHGHPVTYDGMSVLALREGHVERFRAYFDPAHLGRELQDRTG